MHFNLLTFRSNLSKTPVYSLPKVNWMLFLNHLEYMHGFGLFWKVTLWIFPNNRITISATGIE